MLRQYFFAGVAGLYAVFALVMIAVPDVFTGLYAIPTDQAGRMVARTLGGALLSFALPLWWVRKSPVSRAVAAIMASNVLFNALNVPMAFMASLGGLVGPLGWLMVPLHLAIAVGFFYFWRRAEMSGARRPGHNDRLA